jgi:hypothetical protein
MMSAIMAIASDRRSANTLTPFMLVSMSYKRFRRQQHLVLQRFGILLVPFQPVHKLEFQYRIAR